MFNNELLKVHGWMSLTKRSTNHAKSMYILTEKKVRSHLVTEFLVRLGNHQIKHEQPVKYLSVIIYEKLNWS